MHNNVVLTAVQAVLGVGVGALTFDFRGVGLSEGSFDSGHGEQEDVRAAMSFCRALEGVEKVGLSGYSFGAGMAASVIDASVECLALISPSVVLLEREE